MKKHAKIFAENIEQTALDQFVSAMEQDFAVRGALMPDAHAGYSLPIGAVVATDSVVVPAWVGYDIGCGMCAVMIDTSPEDVVYAAEDIFNDIYGAIPTGFSVHDDPQESALDASDLSEIARAAFDSRKGFRHSGTLGGGNHFIEVGSDAAGKAWIVIHSGSRGIGHGIASSWMALAAESDKPKEGHYGLGSCTAAGQDYISDLNWCLAFALENREKMIDEVCRVIGARRGGELINRNHNHAVFEHGMWIHRKGATHAEDGMMGVIPGNMRDGSFIVRGRGCEDALWSSSHGAGRVLGRKQAKRELSLDDFRSDMDGIVARVEQSTLDEAPSAYKSIHEVMAAQSAMVDVVNHVTPILNVKG